MPNHVHLVMVPSREDGLRAALGESHRRYTRRVNARYEWRGHLWQERFHSFPMDEPYLIATVRYVEQNPVAGGLCEHAGDWPWSSASAHLRGQNDRLVDVRPMLELIDDWAKYLTDVQDVSLEQQISTHSRTGRPLGDARFVQTLERLTGRVLNPRPRGPQKRTTQR